MLPKPNRLPHEAFRHVFRTGKRIGGDEILVITNPNRLSTSRFAVQVGVKIDKRAVGRNRMKRLVREAIRHVLPTIKPGFDCILIARKNFAEKKEQEIETTLTDLFKKFT
jgi:ribonuclease P protein component